MKRDRTLRELGAKNINNLEWTKTRFDDVSIKLLSFRDGVACVYDRFAPGARTFPHQHGFRQLRYILEGEFIVNGVTYGPGTLIDFPEFTEYETICPNGGLWLLIQMPGKTGLAPTDPTGWAYNKTDSVAKA
ncbi:cupin domain-containing protein [Mesorhizobium koreense]|jgi:hypothetical protein|uniref:cupin domain-containing protein n=1 Tax=Mesorhizobium koreense TaxID=3074855 RepID=UPI00287BC57E|nr:hypothetical protein [Mesorhizobium sp. WR6]